MKRIVKDLDVELIGVTNVPDNGIVVLATSSDVYTLTRIPDTDGEYGFLSMYQIGYFALGRTRNDLLINVVKQLKPEWDLLYFYKLGEFAEWLVEVTK